MALRDAIEWQLSLIDAIKHSDPDEANECRELVKAYRSLLKKKEATDGK
jgi:hypothetical protein